MENNTSLMQSSQDELKGMVFDADDLLGNHDRTTLSAPSTPSVPARRRLQDGGDSL